MVQNDKIVVWKTPGYINLLQKNTLDKKEKCDDSCACKDNIVKKKCTVEKITGYWPIGYFFCGSPSVTERYLVKWKNFSWNHDAWLTESEMNKKCTDVYRVKLSKFKKIVNRDFKGEKTLYLVQGEYSKTTLDAPDDDKKENQQTKDKKKKSDKIQSKMNTSTESSGSETEDPEWSHRKDVSKKNSKEPTSKTRISQRSKGNNPKENITLNRSKGKKNGSSSDEVSRDESSSEENHSSSDEDVADEDIADKDVADKDVADKEISKKTLAKKTSHDSDEDRSDRQDLSVTKVSSSTASLSSIDKTLKGGKRDQVKSPVHGDRDETDDRYRFNADDISIIKRDGYSYAKLFSEHFKLFLESTREGEKKMGELQFENGKLNERDESNKRKIEQLVSEKKEVELKLKEFHSKEPRYIEDINTLKRENSSQCKRICQLESQENDLNNIIRTCNDKAINLEKSLSSKREEKQRLKRKIESLEIENQSLQKIIFKQNADAKRLQNDFHILENNLFQNVNQEFNREFDLNT